MSVLDAEGKKENSRRVKKDRTSPQPVDTNPTWDVNPDLQRLLAGTVPPRQPVPNFMALLTVSKESTLTEQEIPRITSSIFHRFTRNFCLCTCVLHVTRHSLLTQLHRNDACPVNTEIGSKQSHEVRPEIPTKVKQK